jgi:hypothetical protein
MTPGFLEKVTLAKKVFGPLKRKFFELLMEEMWESVMPETPDTVHGGRAETIVKLKEYLRLRPPGEVLVESDFSWAEDVLDKALDLPLAAITAIHSRATELPTWRFPRFISTASETSFLNEAIENHRAIGTHPPPVLPPPPVTFSAQPRDVKAATTPRSFNGSGNNSPPSTPPSPPSPVPPPATLAVQGNDDPEGSASRDRSDTEVDTRASESRRTEADFPG